MNDTSDGNVFHTPEFYYMKELAPEQEVYYNVTDAGYVLDFSLDGSVEINGIPMTPCKYVLSYAPKGERFIRRLDNSHSGFLSLSIHENTYREFKNLWTKQNSFFTNLMIYPVLKIVSLIKSDIPPVDKNIWINCYTQILLSKMYSPEAIKCSFHFEELNKIFDAVSSLYTVTGNFPLPSEVVERVGINKPRFQKACLAIYGTPLHKIIQHLKMTQAFKAIVIQREEINLASASLGYRHSSNLITAFHDHFSITPLEAVHYFRS